MHVTTSSIKCGCLHKSNVLYSTVFSQLQWKFWGVTFTQLCEMQDFEVKEVTLIIEISSHQTIHKINLYTFSYSVSTSSNTIIHTLHSHGVPYIFKLIKRHTLFIHYLLPFPIRSCRWLKSDYLRVVGGDTLDNGPLADAYRCTTITHKCIYQKQFNLILCHFFTYTCKSLKGRRKQVKVPGKTPWYLEGKFKNSFSVVGSNWPTGCSVVTGALCILVVNMTISKHSSMPEVEMWECLACKHRGENEFGRCLVVIV